MADSNRCIKLQSKQINLSCVVPIYNEASQILLFVTELRKNLLAITNNFEIWLVDDGSIDDTREKIATINDPNINYLRFSRNFGKEAAITAGLDYASGEVVLIVDADFQHPLSLIKTFIKHWSEGFDMVYGVRSNRKDERWLKRLITEKFYIILDKLAEVTIPANAGDFRLLDHKVVTALSSCPEKSKFMKGLYAWVGFKSIAVPFTVNPRQQGKSAWPLKNLIELAITGLTAFSNVPLRLWSAVGFSFALISFFAALYIIIKTLYSGIDVPGYATLLVTILFLGGIQLFSIGILGEYIGKIFKEVKARPSYIISEKTLGKR